MTSCLPLLLAETESQILRRENRDPRANAEEPSRQEQIERLGRRCREGDADAWESLCTTAWPGLVTFVHRLYRSFDQQDAEDIAQASLAAATGNIQTFTGKGSFRGWLFGIAAKQAATFHRRRGAEKRGADLLVPWHAAIDLRDQALSPAEVSAAKDRASILHRAIDALDETDRDLVRLHFFGDLTFKEIAAVRKMNAKTVCTRLMRCREKLLASLNRSHLTNANG